MGASPTYETKSMTEKEIELVEALIDLKIEATFSNLGGRKLWEIESDIRNIKEELQWNLLSEI